MGESTQENRLIQIETPLGKDVLLLQAFHGQEGVSQLFQFDLRMHSETNNVNFADIVGKRATVNIILPDGSIRHINGVISSFAHGGAAMLETEEGKPTTYAHYHATLVPWLWFLTRTSDCRIFQEMTVPDIITKVFNDFGFKDYKNKLQGSFEKREYCVQYRETAFNFVSRLMEEEGIYYYFEHTADKHFLVLANSPSEFKDSEFHKKVNYRTVVGLENEDEVITEFTVTQEVRPGKYSVKDFNFEKPLLNLESGLEGKDTRKYEIYDYPGEYLTKDAGEKLVGVRMQEEETPTVVASGVSTCRGLIPGYRFDLDEHYRRDFNKKYTIISIYHTADQGVNYRSSEEESAADLTYTNSFQCIPASTPYRPQRKTPIPLIQGSQTAIVTGKSGEEIWVDKYGRVKVQFHWDRNGKYDENSSCWVRVSQNWAGKRWGAMFIPRVGQEVIVDFLEGDPDRPIITGRVYNGESMPPYALPDEMTKSTIKSYSSKGGGGFNEIRYEDKKGEEQLFFHAEKEMDIRVKNDRREWIGRDRHLIVKRDKRELVERDKQIIIKRDLVESVERDHHLKITGKEAMEVGGSQSLKVSGNVAEEFGANHTEQVTQNYFLKAQQIVIEASMALTIKAGSSFITIGPAGIQIVGSPMTMINSGGAAIPGIPGMLVPPTAPAEAEIADNADPGDKEPTYKQQREAKPPAEQEAANAPSHKEKSEENKDKKSWIEIELVDDEGKPIPGEKYRVTLPDGSTLAEGTLDEKGQARVESLDPGSCKVSFPDLDKDSWGEK